MDFSTTYKREMFRLNAYSDEKWCNDPDNEKTTL